MSYMHLFAFIFKISKAGDSFCCVSTGVSYFFKSSKRYSLELLSSKVFAFCKQLMGET